MSFECPKCSYQRSWSLRRKKRKCKKCRTEFSPKFYLVPDLRVTEKQWRKCIRIFLRERTILSIREGTGLGYNTVVSMTNILRTCMLNDMPLKFDGPCEMDETYIGGQRKNKKLHIRRIKTKRGHGTDKLPIMGIFGRNEGQVYVSVIPKLSIERIIKIIKERVVAGSSIYTDGYKMYRCLQKHGYPHEYVDHEDGEYVRGDIHTNNIEGFWGILKRKLGCIGGMRRDKLHLFVAEIVWKFNHRHQSKIAQEERLIELVKDTKIGGKK